LAIPAGYAPFQAACRAQAFPPRLPLTHQMRLRQLADLLLELEDLPVVVPRDAEAGGVDLGDVLDSGSQFADVHGAHSPGAT